MPNGLERFALLRIHGLGFTGGDAEKTGVERGGVGEKASLTRVARARGIGVIIEQSG